LVALIKKGRVGSGHRLSATCGKGRDKAKWIGAYFLHN
jgi:hypothetical protein